MEETDRGALIEEAVSPVVGDHGLELVDLEWRGLRPRGVLRLFVDKPGGIEVGDCERLSREVGDVLDAAAGIEGGYELEVAAAGLGRTLERVRGDRRAARRK